MEIQAQEGKEERKGRGTKTKKRLSYKRDKRNRIRKMIARKTYMRKQRRREVKVDRYGRSARSRTSTEV